MTQQIGNLYSVPESNKWEEANRRSGFLEMEGGWEVW